MDSAKKQIIRLHIPSEIKYTKLVEDFMNSSGQYIYPDNEPLRHKMCAVMNEVFTNIVRHSNTSKVDELVRIQMEIGAKAFLISIYDHGPGIEIKGSLPPYDKSLVGEKVEFRKVIDGTVYMTVVNPYSVSFSFEAAEESNFDKFDELEEMDGHGFGISIVTKIMDSVSYSYVGDGKFDWQIIKNLDT